MKARFTRLLFISFSRLFIGLFVTNFTSKLLMVLDHILPEI